jgi:SPP1 gp7 family putative phage head morphogenesis protein
MSALDRTLADIRRDIAARDEHAARTIIRTYATILGRLRHNLDQLVAQIDQAERHGVEVRPGWLFAQDRYLTLINDLTLATSEWGGRVLQQITGDQRSAVAAAVAQGERLALAALGPAPRDVQAEIRLMFGRLPALPLEHLIGRTVGGQPLSMLLATLGPDTGMQVRDALAYGVAAGRNPHVTAREVMQVAQVPLTRARTIARTETLGAYRQAAGESFRQSPAVTGWTWVAQLDTRTCPVCWAMSGTVHDLTESLDSHPNCRCIQAPRTRSWAELGFRGIRDARPQIPAGVAVFARLPVASQRAILGPARYRLLKQGRITLADVVQPTHSAMWGDGRRTATVRELASA